MSVINPVGVAGLISRTPVGAINLLRRSNSTSGVRRLAVLPALRRLSTLSSVDYADAFVLDTGSIGDLTGEQWARATLEDAPSDTRRALRWGWASLGLKLGSADDDRLVLGWEVRRSSPDFALLGAQSSLGILGEVLFKRHQNDLLFATFVQLKNPVVRAAWAGFAARHRQVVRSLLEQTRRREERRQQSLMSKGRGQGATARAAASHELEK